MASAESVQGTFGLPKSRMLTAPSPASSVLPDEEDDEEGVVSSSEQPGINAIAARKETDDKAKTVLLFMCCLCSERVGHVHVQESDLGRVLAVGARRLRRLVLRVEDVPVVGVHRHEVDVIVAPGDRKLLR